MHSMWAMYLVFKLFHFVAKLVFEFCMPEGIGCWSTCSRWCSDWRKCRKHCHKSCYCRTFVRLQMPCSYPGWCCYREGMCANSYFISSCFGLYQNLMMSSWTLYDVLNYFAICLPYHEMFSVRDTWGSRCYRGKSKAGVYHTQRPLCQYC